MKNNILLIIFVIFISSSVFSQENNNSINDKLSVNVELGTSVGKYNNTSFFSNYSMPTLNYAFTPNFSLNAGFLNVNSFYANSFKINDLFSQNNYTATKNYIITQGNYKINDRLVITGDFIYGKNNFDFNSDFNQNISTYSYSIGANFLITEKFQIGVQFRHTQSQFEGVPFYNNANNFNNNDN